MQFLYKENTAYMFMDNESYEQFSVASEVFGHLVNFLKENDIYQLLVYGEDVIGIRFPKKVRLKVVETEMAVKGNTVSGATKPAKLETGVTIQVPLFIKEDDIVGVDPESQEYVDRVNQ